MKKFDIVDLANAKDRVRLLKAGISAKDIEVLYLAEMGIKVKRMNLLCEN